MPKETPVLRISYEEWQKYERSRGDALLTVQANLGNYPLGEDVMLMEGDQEVGIVRILTPGFTPIGEGADSPRRTIWVRGSEHFSRPQQAPAKLAVHPGEASGTLAPSGGG